MEALELLKTWKRICTEAGDCDICPVPCSVGWSEEEDDTLIEMVQDIEKWAAEHPEGTQKGAEEDAEVKAIIDALGCTAQLNNGKGNGVSSL